MHDGAAPPATHRSAPLAGFRAEVARTLPAARIVDDPLRRLAYGTDASLYRLIPQLVLQPDTEDQVAAILAAAARHAVPVTFRAAGTSLSGQAITDSVLVQIGRAWAGLRIEDDGARISLGPAVVGGHANAALRPLGVRIGPDPASIDAAQIGGIAANNASGMCCGTAQNSYRTLAGLRVILADGARLDTADPASRAAFADSHADLLAGLAALRAEVLADSALADRIRRKFAIKNTCGYSLNALVDFDDPIDILAHLMIGSEGTLGFMARVTYRTVPDPVHKAATLAFFPDIRSACALIPALRAAAADAVELLDRAALASVQNRPGMPSGLASLPPAATALLIEVKGTDPDDLSRRLAPVQAALDAATTLQPAEFTRDGAVIKQLWAVRKGTFPSVGAMRAAGTTVIIEDVAVPPDRLADATEELQRLFTRHGYADAIIFGHALEGNLHFVLTPDFAAPGAVDRYAAFMDDLAALIVGEHDGSLKAEHGTGRNMAPYVEMEWGAQAYALMRRIKALFDPDGILNPGVILTDDPQLHTRNIKPMPRAAPNVDACIECGFCEPVCPSRGYTLTPRQRIVAMREIKRLEGTGEDPARLAALQAAWPHQAVNSCAVDSLCALACPVGIDTGAAMKLERFRSRGPRAQAVAGWVGRNFGAVAGGMRWGLGAVDVVHRLLGSTLLSGLARGARWITGGRLPLWTPAMPGMGRLTRLPEPTGERPRVVYFPSCASRVMGPARHDPDRRPLSEPVVVLLHRAGFDVVYPDDLGGLCCGQPFDSKGFFQEATRKGDELARALRAASRDGADPVVFDTSPCALRAMRGHDAKLQLWDLPDFLHAHVLPNLTVTPQAAPVALHVPCATIKRKAEAPLTALTEACAPQVIRPDTIACCGWSGERGFTLPELNANALAGLPAALPEAVAEGVSSSRTCEIGLMLHGGRPYRHIAYLLERCTRAQR